MSINYYWLEDGKSHCPSCECHERIHIGKSSLGWKFLLHFYSDRPIESLAEWQMLWEFGRIEDEYGRPINKKMMLTIITSRDDCRDGKKPLRAHGGYTEYGGMSVPVILEGKQYDTWLDVDFT